MDYFTCFVYDLPFTVRFVVSRLLVLLKIYVFVVRDAMSLSE
jgi:hypothetical protein